MADITITEVDDANFKVTAEVLGETKIYILGISQWASNTTIRNTIANIEFKDTSHVLDDMNIIQDGMFNGSNTWYGNAYNPVHGVNVADVEESSNAHNVNLSCNVNIVPGEPYTLSFSAHGTEGRSMVVGIGEAQDPWRHHAANVVLSSAPEFFVLHLTAKNLGNNENFSSTNGRVFFDMGANTGLVNIDKVALLAGHIDTPTI